jgi:hypothetical protein
MANDAPKKQTNQQSSGSAGDNRQPQGGDTAAVGDNRRAGDQDGNRTGGHSKSRGAREATDDADAEPAKGA